MLKRSLVLATILSLFMALLVSGTSLAGTAGWSRTADNGFGDARNTVVSSMAVYGNTVYAGTTNPTSGCQVWRQEAGGWKNVTGGDRLGAGNTCAGCMTVLNGKLYVGTNKGFDWTTTPGEIWEYDGSNWRRVWAGEGTNERGVKCLAVYGGALYAGTVDKDVSGGGCYGLANVYRWNGNPGDFTRVTANGIDPAGLGLDGKYIPSVCNIVADALAVYDGALYVGTNKG